MSSPNANAAQAVALRIVANNPRAQAALINAGVFTPAPTPTGLFSTWLGANGCLPFGETMLPQIFLYGDAGLFDLNLTDFGFNMPLLLIIDDGSPRANAFEVNGSLANASDSPY